LYTNPSVEGAWVLYVDGSSSNKRSGTGIVLKGSGEVKIEQSMVLKFKTSNNQAKYETLITGLVLAKDIGMKKLQCKTYSQLMVGQIKGELHVKDPMFLKYHNVVKQKMKCFNEISIEHVP